MTHEQDVARAKRAVEEERAAYTAYLRALEDRDDAVSRALLSAPDELSDNALARALDLTPSTLRSITVEARKKRRARRS